MTDLPPALDSAGLRSIRRFVQIIQSRQDKSIPHGEIVSLSMALAAGPAITIDFDASGELGYPLVVVRLAAHEQTPACMALLTAREAEVAALVA
jgi:hypothetical protein